MYIMHNGSQRLSTIALIWLLILSGAVAGLWVKVARAPAAPPDVAAPAAPADQAARPGPAVSDRGAATLAVLEEAFVEIAEKVSPAVVYIHSEWLQETERESRSRWRPQREPPWGERRENEGGEDFWRHFFEEMPQFPFRDPGQHPSEAGGSGMIFREDGYILTNAHVVEDASRIRVKLEPDGEPVEAKLVGVDARTDLAVIKVEVDQKLPTVNFGDSEKVRIGSWALAIGSPFEFESTVTVGIISARGRELLDPRQPLIRHRDLIQTDASINPGNSGGPLVNIRGEVIGVNQAIFTPSGGNIGIGFAVPINTAKKILSQLIERGEIKRGYLGVGISNKDPQWLQDLYGVREGAFVESVEPDSPAAHAGFQPQDVIVEFNGRKITKADDLVDAVTETEPGQKVQAVIVRERKKIPKLVSVTELPESLGGTTGDKAVATQEETHDVLGLVVEELPVELTRSPGAPKQGVLVAYVRPSSPAADAGLEEGCVITQVRTPQGKQEIKTVRDYRRAIKGTKKGSSLAITAWQQTPDQWLPRVFSVKMD